MTRSYRFGEFRLDPATRELLRGDAPVAVPPRAFDFLVYLIEHRERAVGRDELIAAVWGKTDISDGMLGQTVLSARRALEDTGKEQQVIRTVFRFGYHWVAAVDTLDGEQDAAATTSLVPAPALPEPEPRDVEPASIRATPPTNAIRKRSTRRLFVMVAIALLGVLAAIGAQRLHRGGVAPGPTPASTHSQATIAVVLPVTVSAGAGFDWIRLGLMDLIGARLRSAGLAVVPSDNIVALTKRSPPGAETAAYATTLAHATGATLVIGTRAEAVGGRWRVTLRTTWGHEPALLAIGEATDVLDATRTAADQLARQLGYAPLPVSAANTDPPALAQLLQQIEAAILADRLDDARALIASVPAAQRERPELQLRLAQIDYHAGDLDAAEAGFSAIAAKVSAERDAVLHARALTNLGVIAAMRDNRDLATRRFDEAIALLRGAHAPDALGNALLGRASITGTIGRYDAALQDFAEARSTLESGGNLLALAVLDANLGALDLLRLRYAEAEPVFERAASRFATFGMPAAEINALAAAAELKLALLEPDAALAMEPRLRELITQVSDPARQRNAELTCAQILIANGRLREAAADLRMTLDAADRANDQPALAHGHALAAQLALARGDPHQAAVEAGAALQRFTSADDARERAMTLRLRIAALLADGQTDAAAASLATFPPLIERDGNAAARVYFSLAATEHAAAAGDGNAGNAYARLLAEADALRIPFDLREVAAAYAGWLVRSGDLAHASAVAERVAGWSARDYESAVLRLRIQHALGDSTLWRGALSRASALAGEREMPADLSGDPAIH